MTDRHPCTLLLRNARVILADRIATGATILVENGSIARIFEADQSIATDLLIELDGLTLFPGFIDIHIHGAAGVDMMDARANDLCRVGDFLARNGVTAWVPTLVPSAPEHYDQVISAISDVMETRNWEHGRSVHSSSNSSSVQSEGESDLEVLRTRRPQPQVLGVHYEGPFVNTEQCGALHREYFRTFTKPADLDTLPTIKNKDAVHIMTLAPEIEGGIELIKELKKRKWLVSIGHTRAGADVLDEALRAGARHMTHFMNAMTPLHHRALGAVGWGLVHNDVTCDLIADGIHIARSILKFIARAKTAASVSLISDAIAAAGQGDGEYDIWGEKITVTDGRTANARGSIAGSVITMLDAVRMMLSLGFSECEVARMASLNPARLLGIESRSGSIEEGKLADFVAFDAHQTVRMTLIGGQVIYSNKHAC